MRNSRYAPPPIDQGLLVARLMDMTQARKRQAMMGGYAKEKLQIMELVRSYVNWWVLMSTFPERNIVCTVPIWLVRRVHASPSAVDRAKFVMDCMGYLGRLPNPENILGTETRSRDILATSRAVRDMFDDPGLAWEPLLVEANKIKQGDIIRI